MPENEQKIKLLPFHESVAIAIKAIGTREQMFLLALLLCKTKIPQNHDKLIFLWKEKIKELGCKDKFSSGVIQNLKDQKAEVENLENSIIDIDPPEES